MPVRMSPTTKELITFPSGVVTSHAQSEDPLTRALQPPIDESPRTKSLRLSDEEEAKRRSELIDLELKKERKERRKKRSVRLLLLGQSESGKSTTLRQFQRLYTPTTFREEHVLWRAVIQLNVIRSVKTILETLLSSSTPTLTDGRTISSTSRGKQRAPPLPIAGPSHQQYPTSDDEVFSEGDESGYDSPAPPIRVHSRVVSAPQPPPSIMSHSTSSSAMPTYLQGVINRLLASPLLTTIEDRLVNRFSEGNERADPTMTSELFVRPNGVGWKARIQSLLLTKERDRIPLELGEEKLGTDEEQRTLNAFAGDIALLYEDEWVKRTLKRQKVSVEDMPGFFLDDIDRISSLHYMPTDEDVLKARLKTVGVSEYKFEMEVGDDRGTEWRIMDVGGSRSQRPTWIPYFDSVDAIIFLAPISAFNQVLTESPRVNRLEDSVLLWKSICSNKLLGKVDLILFLNKCDLLQQKLDSGVRISRYVRSYGDRESSVDAICGYMKSKFGAIHRDHSPIPRKFYAFCTSVTDTSTTAGIIAAVKDMVIRRHLKQSTLL